MLAGNIFQSDPAVLLSCPLVSSNHTLRLIMCIYGIIQDDIFLVIYIFKHLTNIAQHKYRIAYRLTQHLMSKQSHSYIALVHIRPASLRY